MTVETNIYDDTFFENTKKFESDSARAFATTINKYFSFNSIVDIGCGIGIYLKEFEKTGKEILGYDGAPSAIKNSLVGNKIKLHDLSIPLNIDRKFDVCLCVEVAEHLPIESAETIIDSLTQLSDTVIFTAAVPGQGSREIGHINEQPHKYWIKIFEDRGFRFEKKLSVTMRAKMKERMVIWWIVNNFMVFKKISNNDKKK